MTGLTSLFVARDASENGTTPVGARHALGGLLAGNGASPLDIRAGVLVDNGGAIVSGTANMSYDVRAFRAVSLASTANGPTISANDATVNVTTTVAPGSNSRYDTIWARQHHVTGDGATDTDVIYQIGVTQGTVAASPIPPAVPSGAVALYYAKVTAGATATSGLTFTRAHVWTVANGGVVPIFTSAERSAIDPYEGMAIWYSPDQQLQICNDGGEWEPVGAGQANPIWTGSLTTSQSLTHNVKTTINWTAHADSSPGTGFFSYSAGVLTCTKAGLYRVTTHLYWASNASGWRHLYVDHNGTEASLTTIVGATVNTGQPASAPPLVLAAGDTLSVAALQASGVSLAVLGSASSFLSFMSVEYLGVAAT